MNTRLLMKSKYLCRLREGEGRNRLDRWVHVSLKGQTCILRWFAPEYKEEPFKRDDAGFQALLKNGEMFSLQQMSTLLARDISQPLFALPVARRDEWKRVIELLALRDPVSLSSKKALSPRPSAALPRPPRLIPQTRLRRFYETLLEFPTVSMRQAFCGDLLRTAERTDLLQEIFAESARHFGQYQNVEAKFYTRRKGAPWNSDHLKQPGQFGKCLVARLNPNVSDLERGKWPIFGSTDSFRVVDYEISPLSTTRAVFEDGEPGKSSGAGGVDLLLCDGQDPVPIIGEIKAKTDTDIFLALIQALNYAVELTTKAQLERLSLAYPGHFNAQTVTIGKCEIFLIYEQQDGEPKLLKETRAIAKKLLENPDSPIGRCVRKIRFLAGRLGTNEAELKSLDNL